MSYLRSSRSVIGWVILGLTLSFVPVLQAEAPVTITVGIPGFLHVTVSDTIIAHFEAENPDIHVELVDMDQGLGYTAGDDMGYYLDDLGAYVSFADVLIFNENSLIPEGTRAGYVLDLMSFVRSDPEINVDDFYPQFWNAFQWDGGMWAFPIAGDVIAMLYNPAKFDEAGLPYPDANWSMADFETAVRAMSEVDATTGAITNSAVMTFDPRSPIILSLLDKAFYDPNSSDSLPAFNDAALKSIVQQWYDLSTSGLFNHAEGEFRLDRPMVIAPTAIRQSKGPGDDAAAVKLAPLPGGHSLVTVNGVGISAGSQHPDEAYRFIKYLSNSPEAATAFLTVLPARRSLVGVEVDTSKNPIGRVIQTTDPEQVAEVEALLETAYTPNQTLYASYIESALSLMTDSAEDVNTAFDEQEASFVTARDTAAARNGTVSVTVAEPEAPVVLAPGEIALNFGLVGFGGGVPNREEWQAAIDEFVAHDPDVGAINLNVANDMVQGGLEGYTDAYDCFYEMRNRVPNADLSLLTPLDAYIASDPTYNADDVVSGALEQVKRDEQIWAMPMSIQPTAMWYNPDKISEAGALAPYEGWTIGDFETTLRAVRETMSDTTTAPFISRDGNGTYILELIAAYGALPLDLSQTPPKIDFASEQSIAATKQVLDLARAGDIQYSPLGDFGAVRIVFGDDIVYALYTESLGGFFDFKRGPIANEGSITPTYNLVSFPQGTDYKPIAFDITAAYISAKSPAPEACYRFIQSLAAHPDLFGGMPVLRSLLDSETVIATYGQSAVDFYRGVDSTLTDPRVARFSSVKGTDIGGEDLVALWLYRAWDRYYADASVDLAKELQDAQLYAETYLECLSLAQQDAAQSGGLIDKFGQWRDCAVSVDPSLDAVLPDF